MLLGDGKEGEGKGRLGEGTGRVSEWRGRGIAYSAQGGIGRPCYALYKAMRRISEWMNE